MCAASWSVNTLAAPPRALLYGPLLPSQYESPPSPLASVRQHRTRAPSVEARHSALLRKHPLITSTCDRSGDSGGGGEEGGGFVGHKQCVWGSLQTPA